MKNPFKRNKNQDTLDWLIATQWTASQVQFQQDLRQCRCELETAGFSPECSSGFYDFIKILRTFYDSAIQGEDIQGFLRQGDDGKHSSVYLMQAVFGAAFGSAPLPILHSDKIPDNERHKLRNPRYALHRAAKELIKLSPVGEAIADYRKQNPLPSQYPDSNCRTEGTFTNYIPTMFYDLQRMQSEEDRKTNDEITKIVRERKSPRGEGPQYLPYLNGCDLGEADYYYAAHDLVAEEALLAVFENNNLQNPKARTLLIQPGMHFTETYASRFLLAQQKLRKYSAELGKFFVRGEVGEDGREGQLRLFAPNVPKGTRYYS